MVDLRAVTVYVILAGLIGAIVWDLITWWFGLPTSSSHALFGGYAGAAMARNAFVKGFQHSTDVLIWSGWIRTLLFMVLSPLIGLVLAYGFMTAVYWLFRKSRPKKNGCLFPKASARFGGGIQLLARNQRRAEDHGNHYRRARDDRISGEFHVPVWVILSSCAAIGLGTLSGGWRIIHTMGSRITRLRPRGGFCAEAAAASSILIATVFGVGVSTTHVITGAITGVGSIQRLKAVRWGVATNIVWAWVLTIPAAAVVAWISYSLLYSAGLDPR